MDKISIIIPTYNSGSRISICLDSIINQIYQNLEIIVIDDGSTDNTIEIVNEYTKIDKRIRFFLKENSGVSPTRLFGISKATGDWIGFIDSDDYIDSNMYEILLCNAKQHNADISHCGYQMNADDGTTTYFYNTNIQKIQSNVEGIVDLIDGKFIEPSLCNKLYRASVVSSALVDLLRFPNIRINEDVLFNYFLFKKSNKSIYQDFCPYHYFKPKDTPMHKNVLTYNHIFDPIKVRKIILDDSSPDYTFIAKKTYINMFLNSCNTIILKGYKNHQKDFFEIISLLKKEKKDISIIGKKRSIMARMLIYIPRFYAIIYKVLFPLFKN